MAILVAASASPFLSLAPLLCSIISIKYCHCSGHKMLIIFAAWPPNGTQFRNHRNAIRMQSFIWLSVCPSIWLSVCRSVCSAVCHAVGTIFHFYFSTSSTASTASCGCGKANIDARPRDNRLLHRAGRKRNQTYSIYGNLHATAAVASNQFLLPLHEKWQWLRLLSF